MTILNYVPRRFHIMRTFLLSASVCSIAVLHGAAPAGAQNLDVEEIKVTGQRLATLRAIEAKRNTDGILDAISADDIGRIPDLNTAAALRRIPGISVQNDQGEPRFPVVRGLNNTYNRTTIDGALVASPERGDRTVPLDVVPASLVGRVEAVKTVTPDMDPNAIGGTINLVTRSAFDAEEDFFFAGQAFGGFPEQSGEGGTLSGSEEKQTWRANFATGKRFGADDRFGFVIGLDYSIRNFEIPQVEVDDADYTEFTPAGVNVLGLGQTPFTAGSSGNGIAVPTNNRIFWYNNTRERIGGNAKIEWRPSPDLHVEFSGLYSDFNDDERRDENRHELGTSGGRNQPDTISDQTATSGLSDDGFAIVGLGRFVIDRALWTTRANIDWTINEGMRWETQLVYSGAELSNPESTEGFQTAASSDFGAFYNTSSFFPRTFPTNPAAFFNPANYTHTSRGELQRGLDEDQYEVKSDFTFDLPAGDTIIETKIGGVYRDFKKEEFTFFQSYIVDPASGLTYTLADAVDRTLAGEDFQGGYRMTVRVDSDGATNFFTSNRDGFLQTTDFTAQTEANEQVWGGYLMGTMEFDNLKVIGGLRIENTDWDGADVDASSTVDGSYTNYLPSLLLRYDAADDIVLRAAYTESIGRPDTSNLTSGQTISVGPAGDITVSRSNPDLEPRKSRNVDVSVEWYIPDGIIAVGAFYKDIKDEIFTQTLRDVQVDLGSGPVTVSSITQPVNAQDAEIYGIELQVQQTLSWLPAPFDNFGVSGNLTLLDSKFVIPTSIGSRETGFFQQPDTVANASVYYTTDFFEIRASWNYTGDYLDTIVADDPVRDEYWKDRATLDLQSRINVTEQFSVIGEVQNLTKSSRSEVTGPDRAFLQEHAEFGRTFWVGGSYTF